jgi:DNA-binding transcriptional MerR regulator
MKTDIKKLYYSIGEVSEMISLKSYVLRYWETEFKQLSPPKNNAGNRTYRQKDIDLIIKIKDLLYNKKFTIEGARIMLSSKKDSETPLLKKQTDSINKLINELQEITRIINE